MYYTPHTFKESAIQFKQILTELEHLLQKCAVHKKKFEFSVSQFRRFCATYSQSPNLNQEMKKNQLWAFKDTCDQLSKLHQLLLLHQLDGWESSIIDDPSEYVADALCSISQELHNSTIKLSKEASSYFVYNRLKWVPLHILDIKCIKVSFNKYIESHSQDKEQEANINKMKLRLISINKFIGEFNDKNIMKMISPGVRVFSPIPINSQSWRIQYSDLDLLNKVGEGSSCYVYYGRYKKTGATVAIKQLKFNQLNGDKLKTFQREVGILAKTSHPTLLNFVGATDTFPFCIVTDWMPNGTLFDELHNKKQLDPTMRTIALFDIARGMQYLHSRHIVHRDLKSLNVLIDEKYHACIGDFGLSKDITEDELTTQNVGTPFWMAPEISIKPSPKVLQMPNCYTPKVDVYSYGIILWETSSGLFPQTNESRIKKMKPVLPFTTPSGVRELFDACCDFEPENRPSFDEIVQKFTTGKILLNGANEKRFMDYVKETVGTQKLGTIEDKVQSGLQTDKDIVELIKALLKEGLPDESSPDLVEKCWNAITRLIPQKILKMMPEYSRSMGISFLNGNEEMSGNFSDDNDNNNNDNNNNNNNDNDNNNNNNNNDNSSNNNENNDNNNNDKDDDDDDDFDADKDDHTAATKTTTKPAATTNTAALLAAAVADDEAKMELTEEEETNIILVCRVAPLFLQTSIKSSVASLLRYLPHGSIPDTIIAKMAEMIPSGSEDFDDDIVIASCKNGAADVVAVYSISPQHLKLAFEVVAKEGVSVQLKTAVADKCIQCLSLQRSSIQRARSTNLMTKSRPPTSNSSNNNSSTYQSNSSSTESPTISDHIHRPNFNNNNENENSNNNENDAASSAEFDADDDKNDNSNDIDDDDETIQAATVIFGDIGQSASSMRNLKLRRTLSTGARGDKNSRLNYDNMDMRSLTELTCAAIRCIVGIGEVRRLSPFTISQYLSCDFVEVRNCFYAVLCNLAVLDLTEKMPIEIADIMIDNMVTKGDSLFAENALVALAKISPRVAEITLKKFSENEWLLMEAKRRGEAILRVLMVMMISQNTDLKPVIRDTIDKIGFNNVSSEIQKSINILKNYSES